ncbi:uncharacterized protein F4822DRAFT_433015 [Hypoxylon trugodes]|uniref:uncharacterized protein n=1 Tax=Hypoxylon trugodes TaxID=326681 RepID=UPI00219FC76F|nr:uncharacterized protein F4822DRAFT_433015 [Hypoxylon trugodes]KAI1384470.1 hypothetical protein F4822DRAFT_433015 [Hypoxylon trugodes]
MKKILLLCFIHGFKGGEDTFGEKSEFAQHLGALVGAALPKVSVRAITYPRYETRGDLHECVARFRDWLMNQVIDLEVANNTPSPTVDPSVHVILIGHSMGGIVAAETAIGISSDLPVGQEPDDNDSLATNLGDSIISSGLMFPYIQGVLAFDTPYLGISPGVVAHGAEGHYNSASAALTQLSGLSNIFWGNYNQASGSNGKKPTGALPAPEPEPEKKRRESTGSGNWGWGRIAVMAGAAGAIAAGGAAAYMNRDQIGSGWTWVSSHLEFVGCLARGAELRDRVAHMVRLEKEMGVGFANLYTRLGRAAAAKQVSMVGTVMGNQRTFCNLPARRTGGMWLEAINDKAKDETGAHMAMFEPAQNPGYRKLSEDAKNLIVKWSRNEWYESSGRKEIE